MTTTSISKPNKPPSQPLASPNEKHNQKTQDKVVPKIQNQSHSITTQKTIPTSPYQRKTKLKKLINHLTTPSTHTNTLEKRIPKPNPIHRITARPFPSFPFLTTNPTNQIKSSGYYLTSPNLTSPNTPNTPNTPNPQSPLNIPIVDENLTFIIRGEKCSIIRFCYRILVPMGNLLSVTLRLCF